MKKILFPTDFSTTASNAFVYALHLAKSIQTNTFEMYIDIAEMTGSDYYLYGKLGGEKIIANVPSNTQIKSDTVCNMLIDTKRLHIFDKVSENLICD